MNRTRALKQNRFSPNQLSRCCFFLIVLLIGTAHSGYRATIAEYHLMQHDEYAEQIDLHHRSRGPGKRSDRELMKPVDVQATILDSDESPFDVLIRRTEALIESFRGRGVVVPADLVAQFEELRRSRQADGLGKTSAQTQFAELALIRRQIALANDVLDFNDILFVERDIAGSGEYDGNHMCDQYYGQNGKKGGGLYVLKDAFSDNPTLVDLTAGRTVPSGTNAGVEMSGGSFISPDLSYDGKTVYFAWSIGSGKKWRHESRYNIFSINIDGTDLKRLTDVNEDDFDPCMLPNGRIVFLSTRRGGFGRCHGRPVPTYTMYSMKADGSDLYCIDWHETNEWHPSVDNDGKIVYSRWDYVDRDSDIAHHMWTCNPDGTDPRAPHGNYPHPLTTIPEVSWYNNTHGDGRKKRPWMELNIRAIPGVSGLYVGTAAPHHGQAFGTFVLLDTKIEDDGVMSQVTRLTPRVKFPESEGSEDTKTYGTAYPLSEEFYLASKNNDLILLDKFGNEEVLYTGKRLRPIDPIPVQERTVPPNIPIKTFQGERHGAPDHKRAVVSVVDAYESDLPWPDNTPLKRIRVVQLFPKSTPKSNTPDVGFANQAIARMSLGTAPIEEDGSAHFVAPVGKPIYFQVLDEKGTVVQSMRSVTYVHPGEHLSCVGCHENKWEGTPPKSPSAVSRPPSPLEIEPGAAEPITYYRTVKPIFVETCMPCHEKEGKGPTNLDKYANLREYAFWFEGGGNGSINRGVSGGSRTIPGYFGTRYSKMGKVLMGNAHQARVSAEDFRQVALWLDNMSNRLGACRMTGAQERGELVWPALDVDQNNILGIEGFSVEITADKIEGDLPLTVQLDGSNSSVENGAIAKYFWDLGDGTTAEGPSVSHTFDRKGEYAVKLMVTDGEGVTNVAVKAISAGNFRAPDTQEPTRAGIAYSYYEGSFESVPDFATLSANKSGISPKVSLSPADAEDHYALEFSGYLEVPESGNYLLYLTSDDGSRLWLGNDLLIDNDGIHGSSTEKADVKLSKGKHWIVVEYFEGSNKNSLQVDWSGPGFDRQEVPAEAWSHGDPPVRTAHGPVAVMREPFEAVNRSGRYLVVLHRDMPYSLRVLRLDGRTVWRKSGTGAGKISIEGSVFGAGTFLLEAKIGTKSYRRRFAVIR